MAATDNFRSSLHGFNRTDVVQFIQQQTTAHEKALRLKKEENSRLQEELNQAREEIERLQAQNEALSMELEAVKLALIEDISKEVEMQAAAEVAPLEAPIMPVAPVVAPVAPAAPTMSEFDEMELAAYRRAEMMERLARERAQASSERMKAIFVQTDEKLAVSAQDITAVCEAFGNDYAQLQRILAAVQGIVSESSASIQAAADVCNEI